MAPGQSCGRIIDRRVHEPKKLTLLISMRSSAVGLPRRGVACIVFCRFKSGHVCGCLLGAGRVCRLIGRLIDRIVGRLISGLVRSWFVGRLVGGIIGRLVCRPVGGRFVGRPIGRCVGSRFIGRPISWPISRHVGRLVSRLISGLISWLIGRLIGGLIGRLIDRIKGRLISRLVGSVRCRGVGWVRCMLLRGVVSWSPGGLLCSAVVGRFLGRLGCARAVTRGFRCGLRRVLVLGNVDGSNINRGVLWVALRVPLGNNLP
mmetsp:Transcript_30643/g.59108  ORF Transcript_30643/g.59108 Transcript_30643/m.59108 type:complete len:260 (+) Transcript_30643:129-908(+)